jgi:gas vesicle protein
MAEQKIKETFGQKQKRDVAGTLNELKDKVVKEFEDLKASATAAKEKFEACAKEPGKNYFVCAKEMAEQKIKETFGRQKRDVAGKFDEIKNAVQKEYEDAKAAVIAAKDKLDACAKEAGKNYFTCVKEFAEQKLKETFGRQKRDVAGKVNEIKDAIVKEFEELKASATAAKDKFEACAKEPGKNYFICAKEMAEQKFKETFGKQKRDVSGKFDEIKAAIEKEFDELKTSVTAAKDKFEACAKEPGKNYFICAKEMAEQKIKETFGRRKRSGNDVAWYPSAEEVAAAKQIKICLDMGKDKSECYAKVLGANIDKFDHVKLETITKYEDVLRELRQFLDIRNKGECKTIRECLLALHKAQTAVKNRAFTPQNVQDLINLKTVVLECMAAAQENNVSKCAVALLGPQVAGSDYITMIQQLVNHPAVQEFAKGAGQKLHAYLSTLNGVIAQIHDYAHATYDWVMSTFG